MNLIEDYLRREHHLNDLIDENDSPEIKLEYFFNLFVELEKKYLIKIEDMKRLELEHKAEINNVIQYYYIFTVFNHAGNFIARELCLQG